MITGKSNIMQKQGDFIARKLMLMEARLLRCERLIEEYRCKCGESGGDKEEEKPLVNELSFSDFVDVIDQSSGGTGTAEKPADKWPDDTDPDEDPDTLTFADFISQSGSSLTFSDFIDVIDQSGGEQPDPEQPDPDEDPDTLTFADFVDFFKSRLTFNNFINHG